MNNDRVAEVYDGTAGSSRFQKVTRERLHWMCRQVQGNQVADLGCSQGIASLMLAREGHQVVGIDVEASAIEEANRRLELEEPVVRERVEFRHEDALSSSLPSASADSVLLGEVIEHMIDPGPILDEALRILRPKGRLVLTTPCGLHPYHDHKDPIYLDRLIELLQPRGAVLELTLIDRYLATVVEKKPARRTKRVDPELLLRGIEVSSERLAAVDRDSVSRAAEAKSLREELAEANAELTQTRTELQEAEENTESRVNSHRKRFYEANAELDRQTAKLNELTERNEKLKERVDSLRAREKTSSREASLRIDRLEAEHEDTVATLKLRREELKARLSALEEIGEHAGPGGVDLTAVRAGIGTPRSTAIFEPSDPRLGDALAARSRAEEIAAGLMTDLADAATTIEQAEETARAMRLEAAVHEKEAEAANSDLEGERRAARELKTRIERMEREHVPAVQGLVERGEDLEARVAELAAALAHEKRSGSAVDQKGVPAFVPDIPLPIGPVARPDLRVASILDPFSVAAFRYEFDLIEFGQDDWLDILEEKRPDLLLVESAWRGNDGRWNYTMNKPERGPAESLLKLVEWCRERSIPTVFWNKEDPSNFDLFVNTAVIFDHVFTVDSNCLERYREAGAESVHVLPFGAQPRIHNPIRVPGNRTRGVAFAGSWYGEKHPRRREQMEAILNPAVVHGLEIFSRFQENEKHRFPPPLDRCVIGSLPYERMVNANKLYKVFLNVNSVVDSPTMCARRIFELLASGTPVVSGAAPAIEALIGPEIVFESGDEEETDTLLRLLSINPEIRDRVGHLGLRKVMTEHTYGHRVDSVLEVLGMPGHKPSRPVSMICSTNRPHAIENLLDAASRQDHQPLQVVVVLHGLTVGVDHVRALARDRGIEDLVVVEADAGLTLGSCMNLGCDAADGEILSKFDDDNWYGEHYMSDLIRGLDFTEGQILGKWAHYVWLGKSKQLILRFPQHEHSYRPLVQGGTLTFTREVFDEVRFGDIPRAVDTMFLQAAERAGLRAYSGDRWNFVSVRQADTADHTWQISDRKLLRSGVTQAFTPNFEHAEL